MGGLEGCASLPGLLGLCHRDNARRGTGTDLVSGRSSRNRSTRNQQLARAFSKESPYEARLTRRDENAWEVSRAVPNLREWLGLCHPDDARRTMGTDLVSVRSRRNRSTGNQQLRTHFRKSPPMRPCLARRTARGCGRDRKPNAYQQASGDFAVHHSAIITPKREESGGCDAAPGALNMPELSDTRTCCSG